MKNRFSKVLFIVFLFLSHYTKLSAQHDTTYVDSAAYKTGDLTPPASLGDTVLGKYEFDKDHSLADYKHNKNFAYMKYLDSLLRKTKGLTVDTFSIQNVRSTRGKKAVSRDSAGEPPGPRINIFSLPAVKIVLWILAIFLIGFLVWKLFLGENFFRRNRSFKSNLGSNTQEEKEPDISGYDELIASAVQDKNYRLAVRYSYLQALKRLTDNGLVHFTADKTNYQYVNELNGKPFQNDFAALTLSYEYVWYGKFEIREDVYARLSRNFRSFNQKI